MSDTERLREPVPSVARIMHTAALWFAMAMIVCALFLGFAIGAHWRPALLSGPLQALWWVGATAVAVSLPLLGWSGCPVLSTATATENARKARTVALGTGIFIAGCVVVGVATLLGPGS